MEVSVNKTKHVASRFTETFNSVGWATGGNLAQFVSQFLTAIVLARLLEISDFGLVAVATSVVGVAALLASAGLSGVIVRSSILSKGDIGICLIIAVGTGCLMTAMVFLLSAPLAVFYEMPELKNVMRWLAPLCILNPTYAVASGTLARDMEFNKLFSITCFSQLFGYGFVAIVAAALGGGYWSIVYASLSRSFCYCILMGFSLIGRVSIPRSLSSVNHIWRTATGMLSNSVFLYAIENADYLIIGRTLGAASLGLYSRAFLIMTLPIGKVTSAVTMVLTVSYAKLAGDVTRLKEPFLAAVGIVSLIIFPFLGFLFLRSDEVVMVVFGDKWLDAAKPLSALCVAGAARVVIHQSTALLKARGSLRLLSLCHAATMTLIAFGAFVGSHWGIGGAAFGVSLATCLTLFGYLLAVKNLIHFDWFEFLRSIAPSFLATAVLMSLCVSAHSVFTVISCHQLVLLLNDSIAFVILSGFVFFFIPRRVCTSELFTTIVRIRLRVLDLFRRRCLDV